METDALKTGSAPVRASEEQESAIAEMVRLFYQYGLADAVLGPIFREAIREWPEHMARVADFWSGAIHGTERYRGNVYAAHVKLKFGADAFDHWLAAFEAAASEALAPADAATALRVARHMLKSFEAGLFPFTGADGRPSRVAPRN